MYLGHVLQHASGLHELSHFDMLGSLVHTLNNPAGQGGNKPKLHEHVRLGGVVLPGSSEQRDPTVWQG